MTWKIALFSTLIVRHVDGQGILDSLFAEPTISSLTSVLATATDASVQASLSSQIASLVNNGLSSAQFGSETSAAGSGEGSELPASLTSPDLPSSAIPTGLVEQTTAGESIVPTDGLNAPSDSGLPSVPLGTGSTVQTGISPLPASGSLVTDSSQPTTLSTLAPPVDTSTVSSAESGADLASPTPNASGTSIVDTLIASTPSSFAPVTPPLCASGGGVASQTLGIASASNAGTVEASSVSSFASLAEPVYTSIGANDPTNPLQPDEASSSAGIAEGTQSSTLVQSSVPEETAPSDTVAVTSTLYATVTSGTAQLPPGDDSAGPNGLSTPTQLGANTPTAALDATAALSTPQVTVQPAIPQAVSAIIAGGHLSEYIQSFLDNPGVRSLSGLWESISNSNLRAQISSDVGEIFQMYAREAAARFATGSPQPTPREDTLVPRIPDPSGEGAGILAAPGSTGGIVSSSSGVVAGDAGAAAGTGAPLALTSAPADNPFQGNGTPGIISSDAGFPGASSPDNGSPETISPGNVFPSGGSPDASPSVGSPGGLSTDSASPGIGSLGSSYPGNVSPNSGTPNNGSPNSDSPNSDSPNSYSPNSGLPGSGSAGGGSPGNASGPRRGPRRGNGLRNGSRGNGNDVGNSTGDAGIGTPVTTGYVNNTGVFAPTGGNQTAPQAPAFATGIQGGSPGGTNSTGTLPPAFANGAKHSRVTSSLVISLLIAFLVI